MKKIPLQLQEPFWDEMEEMAERGLIHQWMPQSMKDRAQQVRVMREAGRHDAING
jgi:hypothetical protein